MAHAEKLNHLLDRVSQAIKVCSGPSPVSSPGRAAKRRRVIQDFTRRTDRCLTQFETDLDLYAESREQQDPKQEDEDDRQKRLYEAAIWEQEENERHRQEAEQVRLELEQAQELEELEQHQPDYFRSRRELHQQDQDPSYPHMRPSKPPADPMDNEGYRNLANYALDYNNQPTSQASLFRYIVEVPPAFIKKPVLSDTALKKLVMGYKTEPAVDWAALVSPYAEVSENWQNRCAAFLENDKRLDFEERIRTRENHIQTTSSTNRLIAFVNYIIRTVETLKFTIEWATKDQPWKSQYLTEVFNQKYATELGDATIPETKKARKKFVGEHSKLMSARLHLLMLYHSFGVNVLLDPFWDISVKPSPHKPAFLQLSTLLAAHPPSRAFRTDSQIEYATVEEEERNMVIDQRVCNVASMEPGFVTLVGLLDALSGGDDVSDYVESFLNNFPPSFMSL